MSVTKLCTWVEPGYQVDLFNRRGVYEYEVIDAQGVRSAPQPFNCAKFNATDLRDEIHVQAVCMADIQVVPHLQGGRVSSVDFCPILKDKVRLISDNLGILITDTPESLMSRVMIYNKGRTKYHANRFQKESFQLTGKLFGKKEDEYKRFDQMDYVPMGTFLPVYSENQEDFDRVADSLDGQIKASEWPVVKDFWTLFKRHVPIPETPQDKVKIREHVVSYLKDCNLERVVTEGNRIKALFLKKNGCQSRLDPSLWIDSDHSAVTIVNTGEPVSDNREGHSVILVEEFTSVHTPPKMFRTDLIRGRKISCLDDPLGVPRLFEAEGKVLQDTLEKSRRYGQGDTWHIPVSRVAKMLEKVKEEIARYNRGYYPIRLASLGRWSPFTMFRQSLARCHAYENCASWAYGKMRLLGLEATDNILDASVASPIRFAKKGRFYLEK